MKKLSSFVSALLIAVLFMAGGHNVHAATSTEERIAELMAQVVVLQAELAKLQGNSSSVASTIGVTTSGSKVTFKGEVDPSDDEEVEAWFEYGYTYTLPYSTTIMEIDADGDETSFSSSVSTLSRNTTYYYRAVVKEDGDIHEGLIRSFYFSGNTYDSDDDEDEDEDEDEPTAYTDDADDIDEDSADLTGEIDMQDFEDGLVFFAYGEDEDMVEDVENEDEYSDIDEDGDDLQIIQVDSSFDGDDDFSHVATGLDDDTEYFFRICVEFENDDNDEELACGDVESFETDN